EQGAGLVPYLPPTAVECGAEVCGHLRVGRVARCGRALRDRNAVPGVRGAVVGALLSAVLRHALTLVGESVSCIVPGGAAPAVQDAADWRVRIRSKRWSMRRRWCCMRS